MKSKILGIVCAVAIVGTGIVGVTYANENSEFVKNAKMKIHNCLSMMDFSKYEALTDSQREELTGLQTELKGIMEKEKSVRVEMEEILEEAGVEVNSRGKMRDMKQLTDEERAELKEKFSLTEEEKAELKEKFSLTEEEKAELKENRKFLNGRKEKMAENKVVED